MAQTKNGFSYVKKALPGSPSPGISLHYLLAKSLLRTVITFPSRIQSHWASYVTDGTTHGLSILRCTPHKATALGAVLRAEWSLRGRDCPFCDHGSIT